MTTLEAIDLMIGKFEDGQATPPEEALEQIRSALGRGLPELTRPYPVEKARFWGDPPAVSVIGGGPSLADTCGDLTGCIAAGNGSAQFLLDRGIVPHCMALTDSTERIADIVPVDRRIEYFVASRCHPRVFDRLEGCNVKVWHAFSLDNPMEILQEREKRDGTPWMILGGGTTVSLRWINLGYALGFRAFHMHGMDSSFREWMHAYPDPGGTDRLGPYATQIFIRGWRTAYVFARQVPQFIRIAETFSSGENCDPCTFEVYGDGLLQHCWREHMEAKAAA